MSIAETYRHIKGKQWLVLFTFWTFISAFLSTQTYFTSIKNGLSPNWLEIFLDQLPIWYSWGLVTPLILYIVNKYPINTLKPWRAFTAYLFFGAVLLFFLTNVTLIYMFLTHGYINLSNTNYAEYSPYFFSRVTNDALIYIFAITMIISFRAYGLRKKNELDMALVQLKNDQLQSQLTKAQLQALKLQLNPHFLFNTLHTISSLTLIGESKTSANVTIRLGDFLRRTLDFEEHQLVPLSKEIDFFDLYLAIESVRFKDRLVIEKDIPESCQGFMVPNLILQPLVENAVKHGIAKLKSARLIRLSVTKRDSDMEIQLYNDGSSFQPSAVRGIGLENVKSRLERLYNDNFTFELQDADHGNGVMALIIIPIDPLTDV